MAYVPLVTCTLALPLKLPALLPPPPKISVPALTVVVVSALVLYTAPEKLVAVAPLLV